MVKIKICGITRLEDALLASKLGIDALGFVFHPTSPRNVSIADIHEILATLPPFLTKVVLFCNAKRQFIKQIITQLDINLIQFHGDETAEFCDSFNHPYIKAIRVNPAINLMAKISDYPQASAILLDSFSDNIYGGTGKNFDWSLIPSQLKQPLIIAGGVTADNVSALLQNSHPYAIDVSSGVEISPGIKDHDKIEALIKEVQGAN